MTTIPTSTGFRVIEDFEKARQVWPRGERLDAIRDAAVSFRRRFGEREAIRGVRSFDVGSAAYPRRFAFHGAGYGLNPFVSIINRVLVVQYTDFDGDLRTLVWEPTVPDGVAEAPFYEQMIERFGEFLARRVFSSIGDSVGEALAKCGLRPEDVDYAAFDHLHVQDIRFILGTTVPVDGEPAPRPPMFPNGKVLSQRREVDTLRSVHPMQYAWYVPAGMDGAIEDNQIELDADIELGHGVAILRTPGHTDGNQTLVLNTSEGIWVSSENGVAADNWQPELSRIPGVRRESAFFRREVILNANTLEDPTEQYDSMVMEKTIADRNRRDPRWLNILPSSELAPWKRQWPVVPTFFHGGLSDGEITAG
jgi:hypothetical protein